ncbi:hypothetical protein V1522DRAFT_430460 [Lipomyces starkeyi]
MTDHSDLLDAVRRPRSPDVRLEVPASRAEYERAQEILESDDSTYPQLWSDSTRNIAIFGCTECNAFRYGLLDY